MKKDLLDHGYARLVSYTQPVPQEDDSHHFWSGDLEIVRAARVSYNADWRATAEATETGVVAKDTKLIHSLWKRGHTSPFESMTFTFEIQAPIFVFRQWHRHRTQSYNEVSARYTELPDLFYVPKPEHVGYQSKDEKQGRTGQHELADAAIADIRNVSQMAFSVYEQMLAANVSRELARLVLPVNTYSRMYATASLLNWFRFITLRSDSHAQYEIRVYSDALLEMIATVCPIAVDAFIGYRDDEAQP